MSMMTINEIDQSRYLLPTTTPRIVALVPGVASSGPIFNKTTPNFSVFNGAADLKAFKKLYGQSPASASSSDDAVFAQNNYSYVCNLLQNGCTVVYARLVGNTAGAATASSTVLVQTSSGYSNVSAATVLAKYAGTSSNGYYVGITLKDNTSGKEQFLVQVSKYPNALGTTPDFNEVFNSKYVLESRRVSLDATATNYCGSVEFDYIQKITSATLTALKDTSSLVANSVMIARLGTVITLSSASTTVTAGSDNFTKEAIEATLKDYDEFYGIFKDKYLYDFDFVTSGWMDDTFGSEYSEFSDDSINACIAKLCTERGDCIGVLDTGSSWSAQEVLDYWESVGSSTNANKYDVSQLVTYAPWSTITDVVTGGDIEVPSSLAFLCTWAKNLSENPTDELWYAPAGTSRARCTMVKSTHYPVGGAILDEWQNNHPYRVNPIMKLNSYGYVIFGQATAVQTEAGMTPSVLESLNVRLCCNVIKKTIFAVCAQLSFEYNDSTLWTKFYNGMDEKLRYIKNHHGLSDYDIIMDETTMNDADVATRQVKGTVVISPTVPGEKFSIDLVVTPAGISITEAEE